MQYLPKNDLGCSVRSTINDSRCSAIHRAISLFAAVFLNPSAKTSSATSRFDKGMAPIPKATTRFSMVVSTVRHTDFIDRHCCFDRSVLNEDCC